ncbi:MAG: GH92 family glycosyl hydrolase [Bacteroidales bacterium]|nr:GH92 family glycosyl hydrolase [Bacteroidales bacterium]
MMNKTACFLLAAAILFLMSAARPADTEEFSPVDYVSTLVGTQSDYTLSTGNTYPAIALPWGMHFWTPVTAENEDDGWAYQYDKHRITGFKQTHQPSPWINDYGAFSLMPFTGKADGNPASWFSHKSETAKPYYYKVYLADYDITVEITPSERAAVMRITFPASESAGVRVNPFRGGEVSFDGLWTSGFSAQNHGGVPAGFRNHFVIQSDVPLEKPFPTVRNQVVTLYIASSFISPEQAKVNLREVSGRTFEQVCTQARRRWNEVLGRIRVSGGTTDQCRTFYSCLYRSTLFPRKFYETGPDGRPVHYSPYNGQVEPGYLYTDTGFWDTFRALFPLLNLVYPDVNAEIQSGLANIARENDFLPEWASPGHRDCMIGNNSAAVVADAALQGIISREDLQVLYKALVHGTEHVHPSVSSSGRKGYEYYNRLGYIPYDVGVNENVARTLEYAYDDWCIAQIARLLDRPKKEVERFEKRSGSWRNVFDRESRLMRGRNADGSFQEPFSPYKWGDAFTEGNAWHYTWSVFHDVPGLIREMGGEDAFVEMLDSVFRVPPIYDDSYYGFRIHEITEMQVADMGNYAHGNQPAQHMLYLYDWTSSAWKGRLHIRQTMDRLYSSAPDGYCGDEDNGQTSAWYVFSALGFYPVCPASGQYAAGIPLFEKAVISLPGGKTLEISAPGNGPETTDVRKIVWNGKTLADNFLDIAELKKGGELRFWLSPGDHLTASR